MGFTGHGTRSAECEVRSTCATRARLTRYIRAPDRLLAAGDPTATTLFEKYKQVRMPNLRLSSEDVTSLVSDLEPRSLSLRDAPR